MRWEKIEHVKRNAHLCTETGWTVFESHMDGYWLVFVVGEEEACYGPYENEEDAKMWAERLQNYHDKVLQQEH